MRPISPPDVHELLPPILACLPTAFLSPRPPPALLPLLSPILRQRLHLLASAATPPPQQQQSRKPNWLHLLTWSPQRAERLAEIVYGLQLEPHPVSGEIELFTDGEEAKIEYRRLDSETLQAKCGIPQYQIGVIWTWCTNDTGGVGLENLASGEAQDGWKVAEVLPLDEEEDESEPSSWLNSLEEAEESTSTLRPMQGNSTLQVNRPDSHKADDDNDDAYWAMYDNTPGRTPGVPSPAPGRPSPGPMSSGRPNGLTPAHRAPSADEQAYFARYGAEVQPAMDNHDPDEEEGARQLQETTSQEMSDYRPRTLTNGSLHDEHNHIHHQRNWSSLSTNEQNDYSLPSPLANGPLNSVDAPRIHSPTPSHGSSRSSTVAHLEASASQASAAEIGVKQHISTEMKSLWRLAKAAGIGRHEFDRVIRTELELVGLVEELNGDEP